MKHIGMRRIVGATVLTGGLTVAACSGVSNPQGGPGGGMMGGGHANGWMGGYGGPWMLILLVVISGLVAWIVARGRHKH
ncbi:MAG: hypothetical protein ABI587_05260 [Gemmatimonadales bacterium]